MSKAADVVDDYLTLRSLLAWVISVGAVMGLFFVMLLLQTGDFTQEETVTVRKVDVALPPPPPPPPPLLPPQDNTPMPSIDLMGSSTGPQMQFSDKPELSVSNMQTVERPTMDLDPLDLRQTLSFEIPTLAVENLDSVPKATSYKRVIYPRSLVNRGIKRVDTKVEIIIDQKGKAYVKKIVDPVYPEMMSVIRDWVAGVQFTIPTKNGQPVQAVYLYTIKFIVRV
ncbi:hypothetical protein [Teredinibacter purpureus]|uniref:hypothetical protein n=1 Tax=Teredinibacter purpureus TaxID=2731756 RepID=UPI0005F85BF4|nr:hypothetical protein [Teredinibacter purpureus]